MKHLGLAESKPENREPLPTGYIAFETEMLVCYLYKKDKKFKEISSEAGITESSIWRILKRNHIEFIRQRQVTEETKQQVIDLYQAGEQAKEIVKKNRDKAKRGHILYLKRKRNPQKI